MKFADATAGNHATDMDLAHLEIDKGRLRRRGTAVRE